MQNLSIRYKRIKNRNYYEKFATIKKNKKDNVNVKFQC